MKDLIGQEELAFLAKQNKEEYVEQLLTETSIKKVTETTKETLSSVLGQFNLEPNSRVTGLSLSSFDFKQGGDAVKGYEDQSVIAFVYRSNNQGAKHLFLLSVDELKAQFMDQVDAEASEESVLMKLSSVFNARLQAYYETFSKLLDVQTETHLVGVEKGLIGALKIVEDFDLKQLCEVKDYEFVLDGEASHSFKMLHLSDLGYMEFLYTRIQHDPILNSSPRSTFEDQIKASQIGKTIGGNLTGTEEVSKPVFQSLSEAGLRKDSADLGLLNDVPLEISVVLGKTVKSINEILELNVGSIVELNKYAEDPLEIYANDKLIAEGEVVIVDENFGIKITKLNR